MPINPKTGKKFNYTPQGIEDARRDMLNTTSPDAIMKYGGGCGCGKTLPKYSNNPRVLQGRQLRRGGCV